MTKPSIDRIIRDSRDGCLVLSQGEALAMVKEIERLRAALKPFAEFAGQRVGRPPDDMVITQGSRIARRQLTMGDCRKAHEALHPEA